MTLLEFQEKHGLRMVCNDLTKIGIVLDKIADQEYLIYYYIMDQPIPSYDHKLWNESLEQWTELNDYQYAQTINEQELLYDIVKNLWHVKDIVIQPILPSIERTLEKTNIQGHKDFSSTRNTMNHFSPEKVIENIEELFPLCSFIGTSLEADPSKFILKYWYDKTNDSIFGAYYNTRNKFIEIRNPIFGPATINKSKWIYDEDLVQEIKDCIRVWHKKSDIPFLMDSPLLEKEKYFLYCLERV